MKAPCGPEIRTTSSTRICSLIQELPEPSGTRVIGNEIAPSGRRAFAIEYETRWWRVVVVLQQHVLAWQVLEARLQWKQPQLFDRWRDVIARDHPVALGESDAATGSGSEGPIPGSATGRQLLP